jgi:hypothetical protein
LSCTNFQRGYSGPDDRSLEQQNAFFLGNLVKMEATKHGNKWAFHVVGQYCYGLYDFILF